MEGEAARPESPAQDQDLPARDRGSAETRAEADVIVIRLNRTYVIVAFVAVVFFLGGYLTHAFVASDTAEARAPVQETGGATASSSNLFVIDADDDPFLGPADAPVTIIEFSDFECPFCKRFHDETFDRILDTYEGRVRYVYRDFPLSSIHPAAQKAAEAAECADEQGQFWAIHEQLFAAQADWANASNVTEALKSYAAELGLDGSEFDECLDTGRYAAEVLEDLSDGTAYGIMGTPTFYVNGVELAGAQPFSAFQEVIDRQLAELGQ
jgi:protein-disulfide isomerase